MSNEEDKRSNAEHTNKKDEHINKLQRIIDEKVNTVDLICRIEKYPAIWDRTKEAYVNKIEKRKAWQSIMSLFISDFNDRPAAEKNALVTMTQKKWKGIRSCYSRELLKKREERSMAGASGRKQYVYFEILRFLESVSKKSDRPMDEPDAGDTSLDNEEEARTNRCVQQASTASGKSMPRKRANRADDKLIKVLKKKIAAGDDSSPNVHDEDRMFLLSLVSQMNRVPQERKLRLRSDIMAAIDSAQTPVQQWTHQQNPPYQNPVIQNTYTQYAPQRYVDQNPTFEDGFRYMNNAPDRHYKYEKSQSYGSPPNATPSPGMSESSSQMSDFAPFQVTERKPNANI